MIETASPTAFRPAPATPVRRRNVIVSHRVWALARRDYLNGASGPQCCDRYGMTIHAFRARARRHGWTKRAAAEAAADAWLGPDGGATLGDSLTQAVAFEEMEPRMAARRALEEAVRLACAGKMAMAAEAARVADLLARTAVRLEAAGVAGDDDAPGDEAVLAAVRARVVALAAEDDRQDRAA